MKDDRREPEWRGVLFERRVGSKRCAHLRSSGMSKRARKGLWLRAPQQCGPQYGKRTSSISRSPAESFARCFVKSQNVSYYNEDEAVCQSHIHNACVSKVLRRAKLAMIKKLK